SATSSSSSAERGHEPDCSPPHSLEGGHCAHAARVLGLSARALALTGGVSERIRLPTLPEGSDKPGFPLLATAAPVAGSLVMWMLTQSPYALLFALLGPLVAL